MNDLSVGLKKEQKENNTVKKIAGKRPKKSRNKFRKDGAGKVSALLILVTNLAIILALLFLARSCSKTPFVF